MKEEERKKRDREDGRTRGMIVSGIDQVRPSASIELSRREGEGERRTIDEVAKASRREGSQISPGGGGRRLVPLEDTIYVLFGN